MDAEFNIMNIDSITMSAIWWYNGQWRRVLTITTDDGSILDVSLNSLHRYLLDQINLGDLSCTN